jgi:hypothetical protein
MNEFRQHEKNILNQHKKKIRQSPRGPSDVYTHTVG